ncbi:Acetyl-CoA acetyltransferase [Candidatus Xenohaliotis californiensis]|uniref:Acetyl-CoA acetyltransferase n=1 Tax=Candidatus Xenohaliotis californiensis TaxID=84677 RepID=A0ABP0EUK2_9RICK|nr:Acetyl-CoA acetyltransferase [Candidatus Xenohaliotis californiensis]
MQKKDVYLVAGKRTAITNFCSSFSKTPAHHLTKHLISHLLQTYSLEKNVIDEIIIGQVITAGCGQNPARQAAIEANIDFSTAAWTINQMCASGLKSVILGAQSIANTDNNLVIAGGQENMSLAPHALHLRSPPRMGHFSMKDLVLIDGLIDAFGEYHMGVTAENLATKYNISREEQDQFAHNSHIKAAKAIGKFSNEILPIEVSTKKGYQTIKNDEFIKPDTTIPILASLKAAFVANGTVTAGNAAGINDGAACLLLSSTEGCKKHNLQPKAKIVSYAQHGVDPSIMGIGPVIASRKALKKANWQVDDLDLIEINEAFAAQVIAVNKEMKWDTSRQNINGGAIALGHPIGASGSRCLVTAMNEMETEKLSKCLITLCAGGGMGIALCIEKV